MDLGIHLLVLSVMFVWVPIKGEIPGAKKDPDIVHSLHQVEERLRDQETRIKQQETRFEQQETRIKQQEIRFENQEILNKLQENRLKQQEQTISEQREEMDKLRERIIQMLQLQHATEDVAVDYLPVDKRSDDSGPVLDQMTQKLTEMTADIQALKNADQARGTTYTRWGHAGCPADASLVYTGILSGSKHSDNGGPGNHLCLTSQPMLDGHTQPSGNGYTTLYGSEYQTCPETECDTTPACAVCHVSRAATVMIPGTTACTTGWNKEYSGHIMALSSFYPGSSEYICVDSSNGQYSHTSQANDDQNLLYYTHFKCGALPCPPYVQDKIATCVVCSK